MLIYPKLTVYLGKFRNLEVRIELLQLELLLVVPLHRSSVVSALALGMEDWEYGKVDSSDAGEEGRKRWMGNWY